MRCPTLKELPPAPEGKNGWPWTEESPQLPEKMLDGSEWPKISIVTPNYNYGQFIEETIRSVLLQGYPNLEYIIIDGASTDNSVEVIKKYEPWLAYWVSEKDHGQTDAINKGFTKCTGDLFVWLNSDDAYKKCQCLGKVAELFTKGYSLIVGQCLMVDIKGNPDKEKQQYGESVPINFIQYLKYWQYPSLPQPAVFIDKKLCDNSFPLDLSLYIVMDYQLFLRVLKQNPKSIWINEKWVNFKYHGNNKTAGNLPEEFDGFEEIYQLLFEESKNLPFISKKIYRVQLENYKSLNYLQKKLEFFSTLQVICFYRKRLLLLLSPLAWKIIFKSLLGNNHYQLIKRYIK